jgi:hypothetical protein
VRKEVQIERDTGAEESEHREGISGTVRRQRDSID